MNKKIKVVGVGELANLVGRQQLKEGYSYVVINKKKLIVVGFLKALALPNDVKVVTTVETNIKGL